MQLNYKLPSCVLVGGIILLSGILLVSKSIVYNQTFSEPIGWYWTNGVETIEVGELYTLRVPIKSVSLLEKLGYKGSSLLKRVVAKAGDDVEITSNGVMVNGEMLRNSKAIIRYKNIYLEPLPVGYRHKLRVGEFFVMGETAKSYDSRYFGIINSKDFIGHATLLIRE